MAYVTVEWEYGDTSTIEGFRIYRDDELRAEVAPNVRSINDSVDDTTETRVKYEIKAFDSAGRESYGCQYSEVLLLSIQTPKMTSDTEPAGHVIGFHEGLAGNGYNQSGIVDPWKTFNRTRETSEFGATHFQMDDGVGPWKIGVEYRFSEATRAVAFGYVKQQRSMDEAEYGPISLKVYGSNTDGGVLTLITELEWEEAISNDTLLTKVLDDAVYFKNYRIVGEGYKSINDVNRSTGRMLFSEFYIYNRDEV
jgi:hypothetical protein